MSIVPSADNIRSSWFTKFIECAFTGFAVVSVFETLMEVMPESYSFQSGNPVTNLINAGLIVLGLAFALFFPVYWQKKEKKLLVNSTYLHALFQGILRYWIAFEVSRYGFAKLFQTQFPVVFSREDSVVNQLNGFDLTWSYFGHSYVLAVIIGLLQITGSIFLLFRRTTLLGVVILLPVLLNIALIDWFFDIAWGALLNSVSFTLGLLYLLLLRWKELKEVFLRAVSLFPKILPVGIKHLIRVAILAASFAMVLYFASFNKDTALAGKWTVIQMTRNGDTLRNDAWLSDSTAWKNIYIEKYGRLALCPNPYFYDAKKSQWAQYKFDGGNNSIELIMQGKNKNDTLDMSVSFMPDKTHMEWKNINPRNGISLILSRVGR